MARRRSGSLSRGRNSATSNAPASPYIRRSIPFYDILDIEQVDILEAQVDWILQDKGIAFFDDSEALDLWRREGATIGGDDGNIVRASADWIRDLCRKAPHEFTQLARNPDRSVIIGGQNQVFAPIYGAPFIRDLENGRRYGDIAAFNDLVRLTYMLPYLHHGGFVTCEPCDVPVSKRHLDMLLAHMTLSDKPHLGAITEMSRAQDSVDMAEIVFGSDVMAENCVIMGNVNTNSPLLIDKVVTQAIRTYCGRGQGIVVRLGVPVRSGGGQITAANSADGQVMQDSSDAMWSTLISGANQVWHAAGWLEGGLTMSYEKFVMDCDHCGMMLRLLGGMSVTDEALPKAPYLEVDVGENFLSTGHTIEHFATCNYQPDIPDAGAYEIWVENKAPTAEQRANRRWKEMLKSYEMPPMNPEIDAALCDFIARKKESMPDAWY